MVDIKKKYNLPLNLNDADDNVKEMVVKGALRTYVKNFYEFGRPILAKMYKIDKGENGQRFMSSVLFDSFAGQYASNFNNLKPSKYRNLSLVNLAFYCNYLQGVFSDLVGYHKEHNNVTINTFEARVKHYGNFMRSQKIRPYVTVAKDMANQTDYKESLAIYEHYLILNSRKVQDLINNMVKETIFKNPLDFEAPFVIDLDYMKNNNYFDKRKDQFFNLERYPKEIEKMEQMYQDYLKQNGLSNKQEDYRDLPAKELINLDEKSYDEDYVIYDELEM